MTTVDCKNCVVDPYPYVFRPPGFGSGSVNSYMDPNPSFNKRKKFCGTDPQIRIRTVPKCHGSTKLSITQEKGTDLLERGVSPLAPHSPFFLARAGLVEEGGREGRGSPPRPSPPSSCSSTSPSSQHVWKDLTEQKNVLQ